MPMAMIVDRKHYPAQALADREEGDVTMQYVLNPSGVPQQCKIKKSSGSAVLDSESCRLLTQRLIIAPKRDKTGRAIASAQEFGIAWNLPSESKGREECRVSNDAIAVAPGQWLSPAAYSEMYANKKFYGVVEFAVSVSMAGAPLDCKVLRSTTASGVGDTVCRQTMARAFFLPAVGSDGQRAPSAYIARIRFETPR